MAELIDDDGDVRLENLDEAPTGLDSAQVTSIAEGATMTVYDSLSLLPISNLTAGTQAFVKSNKRLYVSNGSGWYNVALINLTPTMSLDQSGTVVLSTEGAATTVTITAQDSDNPDAILSYSVDSDGNGNGNYIISQDSSVFTITPLTEDSGATAATFTLTFSTTDNINTATSDLDFSLTFSNIIDSSAETVLLLKAANEALGNYANKEFTFKDSADTATDWTANVGNTHAFTFNPYQGPYSTKFDGNDYLDLDFSAIGTSDFTIESWVYITNSSANQLICDTRPTSTDNTTGINIQFRSNNVAYVGSFGVGYITGTTVMADYTWNHIAVTRTGGTMTLWVNGTSEGTASHSVNLTSTDMKIGTNRSGASVFHGYIRDLRLVKSAVYTSSFTPPTEPLTAITNTEILACNLPYLADASSNDHTVTSNGNCAIVAYSPYDKEPYKGSQHGMSLQFNGTNQRIQYSDTTVNPGTSDCTWEGWFYPYTEAGTGLIFETQNRATAGLRLYYSYNTWTVNGSDSLSFNYARTGTTARQWTHFAVTKSGSTYQLWIDGKDGGSDTGASDVTGDGISFGCSYGTNTLDLKGAIADFHVTKEVKYTAAFTPPTKAVAHDAGKTLMRWADDVKMYDASGTHEFHRLSAGGGPQLSTSTRKFTTSAAYSFDGGDYIGIGSEHNTESESTYRQDELPNGTEDFTIEMWFNCSSFSNYDYLYSQSYAIQVYLTANGYIAFATNDEDSGNTYTTNVVDNVALSTGTWYHMAFVRNGSSHKLYINGTEYLSATSSDPIIKTRAAGIGVLYHTAGSSNYWFNGFIQDVRITKGLARYTAAFTPPTAEFEL